MDGYEMEQQIKRGVRAAHPPFLICEEEFISEQATAAENTGVIGESAH
jgi:hypothetical protein